MAFFGAHYVCVTKARSSNVWTLLDDANVVPLGTWEEAVVNLAHERLQPTVLFYEHEAEYF